MKYVYELRHNNKVVWVGESKRPKGRLWQHTSKNGKFTGLDIDMSIVAEFETREEAYRHQCELQEEYGLVTDREKVRRSAVGRIHSEETKTKMSKSRKGNTWTQEVVVCPYCNKPGGKQNMTRYHFDNCKNK